MRTTYRAVKKFLRNNWQPLILATLSFLTRFLFLGYPPSVVFDETAFGGFVKDYFTHQYYFDIHPPLGKLIISFFVDIFGIHSATGFSAIGQAMNSGDALVLRFLPAFFGAVFVISIYYLILKMGLSKKAAFLGAALVLFDNAILVQSRFILIDIFLLFFGFLSLYFLLCFKDALAESKKAYCFLALSAISAALSFSIKWTGLSFFAIVGLFFLADTFKKFDLKRVFINLLLFTILPFLVYYSVFVIHFSVLTRPGSGDAYMSPAFQQMIEGKNGAPKLGLWEEFVELNQKMYFYNSTLRATHPYSSKWYQWPTDKRPIWYWTKQTGSVGDTKTSSIYLIGNPIIWWAVLFGIAFSIIILPFNFFRKKFPKIFYILILGYFINLLPFIFISRVAFLYHYFSSLIFGILILAVLYETFLKNVKNSNIFYWSFICLVFLCFLLISPLTYGIPISSGISHYYSVFVNFFL